MFLAATVALSILLALEWLLPGAVTTIVPLYLITAGVLTALVGIAPQLREAPLWKRFVGTTIPLVPALVLGGAFAFKERAGSVVVVCGMMVLLVGVLLLTVGFDTDESTS